MAETKKAFDRREREGFFRKYCMGKGLDIGAGNDPLATRYGIVDSFDKENGDACYLNGIADESYDFVYSSHCLEHLDEPHIALRNWFRVLKTGGYLIVCVPHRDLYEKKKLLPSIWNGEHKSFWLPFDNEPPHTWGLKWVLEFFLQENIQIEYIKVCDEGWKPVPVEVHSFGEYQIECVARKC